jgi:hypothetical protein
MVRTTKMLSAVYLPTRRLHAVWALGGPNGLGVIVTIDNTPRFGSLLHVSISHHRRDPLWSEIKALREVFFPPDIDVMMMLPRESDYVNLHPHTFHLIQTPERWDLR